LMKEAKDERGLAQVKAMARESFQGLIGAPPERVQLTAQGRLIAPRP
jgi:hypothetical protein